jgi:hypothetical protein
MKAMRAVLTLTDPEQALTVQIDSRDRRVWEVKGHKATGLPPGPVPTGVGGGQETYFAWMAWHALAVRAGHTDLGDWPSFNARLVEVEVEAAGEDDPLGDPTKPAK